MSNRQTGYICPPLLLLALLLTASQPVRATPDVALTITGTLRTPPCELEDSTLTVVLPDSFTRVLLQGPTPTHPFTVKLKNCDATSVQAKVTLRGTATTGNGALLALDAGSKAQGVGLGFKQGVAMLDEWPLGQPSKAQPIAAQGQSVLYFGAYVQPLPGANLVPGTFVASATLTIKYE